MTANVCIIIVAFNSRTYLGEQIQALAAQSISDFDVIVVDNASRPDQQIVPADLPPHWRLIQSSRNLGFAVANNLAAQSTTAQYLALLNPDAFPAPDWLERLVRAADSHGDVAAFGSTQISADDSTRYDGLGDVLFGLGLPYRSGYGAHVTRYPRVDAEVFSACAAAMLVRREAFESIGGFDDAFFCYCEDVDLGFRLRLRGMASMQISGAIVRHVGGGVSGARSAFGDFHGARNRLWMFVQNMPGPMMWALLPAHVLASALVMTLQTAQGRGFHAWRGFLAGVTGLARVFKRRRTIQSERTASIASVLAAMAWNPLVLIGRRPVYRTRKRH